MTIEEADEIRLGYGKFLEVANGQLIKLFLTEIPECLLPYPKKDIEEALGICIDFFRSEGEEDLVETFKAVRASLIFYKPVKQALKSASERFADPDFIKMYLEQSKSHAQSH